MDDPRSDVIIRADASAEIGTGHVMRCLALAQAWQDSKGHAIFAMTTEAPAVQARLRVEGMGVVRLSDQPGSIEDAVSTVDLARKTGAKWVVVDGYHFKAQYHQVIKARGLRLLVLDDDGHAGHYYADVVVNQNLHATPGFYVHRESYTQLLLGIRYVLLRQEFLRRGEGEREIPAVASKILVTLGGADPQNHSAKVIRALQAVKAMHLSVVVVAGPANPHISGLEEQIVRSGLDARVVQNVTNMSELMAWADVAVCTAGSTVWELAFMGVPTVVGVSVPIEERLASGLDAHGLFVNVGWLDRAGIEEALARALAGVIADKSHRHGMSELGRHLVDGRGCTRVLEHCVYEPSEIHE